MSPAKKREKKGPRLTLPEIIRIVGACGAVIVQVRAEIEAARAASDGPVTVDTVRRVVLRVLGLPETLPKGAVAELVDAIADAVED